MYFGFAGATRKRIESVHDEPGKIKYEAVV
jgi:hypothetical protein